MNFIIAVELIIYLLIALWIYYQFKEQKRVRNEIQSLPKSDSRDNTIRLLKRKFLTQVFSSMAFVFLLIVILAILVQMQK